MNKCFGCGEDIGRVAIVHLVYTYRPFIGDNGVAELRQVAWHKGCYANVSEKPLSAVRLENELLRRDHEANRVEEVGNGQQT